MDIVDRPNYPHEFIKADALEVLQDLDFLSEFDAYHGSPPCQAECTMTKGTNAHLADRYEDLYDPVRLFMGMTGKPGVIENPRSRKDMVLCGEMFGLGVIRHRNIELLNWSAPAPKHKKHRGRVRGYRHGVWYDGPYIAAYGKGGGKGTVQEMQEAMGIDWTDVHEELTEAIPPAYSEYIGHQLMAHLKGSGS
ncbi:DNA methylase [Streptomyces althioticus]|uniref:DNA methylase n=1 Tax=Streptomyces althioticus TaxID=83380 RepID=UPI0037864513